MAKTNTRVKGKKKNIYIYLQTDIVEKINEFNEQEREVS